MKKFLLLTLLLTLELSVYCQTKNETIKWIAEKLGAVKTSDNDILICCNNDGKSFCYRTNTIQVNYVEFPDDPYLSLLVKCNYLPDGSVPPGNDTEVSDWMILINGTARGITGKITRVTVEQPKGCWQGLGGQPYLITFYANSLPNKDGRIAKTTGKTLTAYNKITFAINLDFEENLAERLKKAFDHLIGLSKPKETF